MENYKLVPQRSAPLTLLISLCSDCLSIDWKTKAIFQSTYSRQCCSTLSWVCKQNLDGVELHSQPTCEPPSHLADIQRTRCECQ